MHDRLSKEIAAGCALACLTVMGTVCATTSAAASQLRPIQSMLAPTSVRKLYVVDIAHNAIDLFPAGVARPRQIGAITQGINAPTDAFVDGTGTLYVANVANTNPSTVTEYAPGSSVPKLTLALGRVHPLYITVGPDGTVYTMVYNKYQRWEVLEFDAGARKPSRKIEIPYEFPYPLVGGGIATDAGNFLYMNSGSYSGQGDFFISVFPPKHVKPFGGFTSGGYAGGAVQISEGQCFVGDPGNNNVEMWPLPVKPKYTMHQFATESSGDFLTVDPVSDYLYSVSYGNQTLQIYDLHSRRLLSFLPGFSRGVAIDPVSVR